jgi:hypothetical protein
MHEFGWKRGGFGKRSDKEYLSGFLWVMFVWDGCYI